MMENFKTIALFTALILANGTDRKSLKESFLVLAGSAIVAIMIFVALLAFSKPDTKHLDEHFASRRRRNTPKRHT